MSGERVSSEALLRAIVSQSTDLILVLTPDKILFASPSTDELFGGGIVGRTPHFLFDYVHPEDLPLARAVFAQVFEQPGRLDATQARLRRDDDWAVFEVVATNLTEQPEIGGVLFSGRDVTERHRAHARLIDQERLANAREMRRREERVAEQLRRARQMDTVGRLAAGAAHDFGNLLGVIANCTASILRTVGDDNPARKDLEAIDDAVERASDLVRQLLLFGSPTAATAARFDLRAVVDSLVSLLSSGTTSGVSIENDAASEPLEVVADRHRIERAVMNVAVNALQAMPTGGRLRFRTDRVYVTARPATALGIDPGSYARLTIRDDGPGMTPDVQERAFEPFFTTSAELGGTGLGLPTAKDALERAGGAIALRSHLGRGTSVTMLLPLAPLRPAWATTGASLSSGATGRIVE